MLVPLWDRFDAADDKVKGDILYRIGEIDNGVFIGRIREVLINELNSNFSIALLGENVQISIVCKLLPTSGIKLHNFVGKNLHIFLFTFSVFFD